MTFAYDDLDGDAMGYCTAGPGADLGYLAIDSGGAEWEGMGKSLFGKVFKSAGKLVGLGKRKRRRGGGAPAAPTEAEERATERASAALDSATSAASARLDNARGLLAQVTTADTSSAEAVIADAEDAIAAAGDARDAGNLVAARSAARRAVSLAARAESTARRIASQAAREAAREAVSLQPPGLPAAVQVAPQPTLAPPVQPQYQQQQYQQQYQQPQYQQPQGGGEPQDQPQPGVSPGEDVDVMEYPGAEPGGGGGEEAMLGRFGRRRRRRPPPPPEDEPTLDMLGAYAPMRPGVTTTTNRRLTPQQQRQAEEGYARHLARERRRGKPGLLSRLANLLPGAKRDDDAAPEQAPEADGGGFPWRKVAIGLAVGLGGFAAWKKFGPQPARARRR